MQKTFTTSLEFYLTYFVQTKNRRLRNLHLENRAPLLNRKKIEPRKLQYSCNILLGRIHFSIFRHNLNSCKIATFGCIKVANHCTNLFQTDTAPVHLAPYWETRKTQTFEKTKINKMIADTIIKPARADWGAPTVFVPRKGRSIISCKFYRRLKPMTKQDSYRIPSIDICISSQDKELPIRRRTLTAVTDTDHNWIRWQEQVFLLFTP